MATTEVLTHEADAHDDHHGDHPSFLAHHFDTPEQQYDSGKLGMWLFLVTEVLFFSGLFCAYAIYRFLRPDVFAGCSEFLNTQLGAINTGVLLFSSLTMAWAVRCAQLEQHKMLTGMLAATLSCASIFLGVKAIEYSHKFGMGLLPGGFYSYVPGAPHDGTIYLVWISAPFAIILLGLFVWYVVACLGQNKFQMRISGPMTIVFLCYFAGVGLGTLLESGSAEGHHEGAAHASASDHEGAVHEAGEVAHEAGTEIAPATVTEITPSTAGTDDSVLEMLAVDTANTGVRQQLSAAQRQQELSGGPVSQSPGGKAAAVSEASLDINNKFLAGGFFSIYYCMTGIHAIHILAGMGVLTWLLVRSVRHDFNRQYFGPVDYVGLYWHIVDLIWIYLFPLLYLIR